MGPVTALVAAILASHPAPPPPEPAARIILAQLTLRGVGRGGIGAVSGGSPGQLDFSVAAQSGLLTLL